MGVQIFGCGTKQFSRTLRKGEFECPRCTEAGREPRQSYKLESYKHWVTFVWIPVIPMSSFDQVTCKKCRCEFPPNALDLHDVQ